MDYNICEEYLHLIRSKIKQADYEGALSSIERLLSYDSNMSVAHYYKGICYYGLYDFIRSIDAYVQVLELDPQFAKAYYNMGLSKYKLDVVEEAAEDIQKAKDIFIKENELDAIEKCNITLEFLSRGIDEENE